MKIALPHYWKYCDLDFAVTKNWNFFYCGSKKDEKNVCSILQHCALKSYITMLSIWNCF